ncbi:MAG: hypothetical protein P8Y17_01225 [Patescibacteria group bacterium]
MSAETITNRERVFIMSKSPYRYYIMGFLACMRERETSLQEEFDKAMSQPFQEEHHEAYRESRKFLTEHAEVLGVKLSQEE